MKLIFDFDHTVYDMTAMHQSIVGAMKQLGIEEEEYQRCYHQVTNWKLFTVDAISQRLHRVCGAHPDEVTKAFHSVAQDAELYVYDDVIEHFKLFKDRGHRLSLLSWGDKDWQHTKIQHSGLMEHCEDIITVHELKADYFQSHYPDHECLVLIDDKPAELKAVQDVKSDMKMIRLRRDNGKYSDIDTPMGIPEARSMAEVADLIKQMRCLKHDH